MRHVLNSAVLTAFGCYRFEEATVADLAAFLHEPGWVSSVGYAETADAIRRWTGVSVPLSREPIVMGLGDVAMVVRLKYRVADPTTKGRPIGAKDADWEISRLTRILTPTT